MATRTSAGLLLHRWHADRREVCLVHPGGPYWARRDVGAWSIPKGEIEAGEDPLAAARRECAEETGHTVEGEFVELPSVRLRSGKIVQAWAVESDLDVTALRSTTFTIEWPPRSGVSQTFPEVDRAAWFSLPEARLRILPGMRPFIDSLDVLLKGQA